MIDGEMEIAEPKSGLIKTANGSIHCRIQEPSKTDIKIKIHQGELPLKSATSKNSMGMSMFWLGLWFVMNMGVTILNKKALNITNFPIMLTFIHMLCNSLGAIVYTFFAHGLEIPRFTGSESTILFFFSFVFVSNIIMGNWSLGLVSISFNQVMRALVPGTTLIFSTILLQRAYSAGRKLALLPIALGVYLACSGDKSSTALGWIITVIAVIFAALKAVLSSKFLTGSMNMHPVSLILHQAPLSALWCYLAAIASGEWQAFSMLPGHVFQSAIGWFVVTGILSFSLNVTSFFANKVTSALTLAVCANIKQVVVVALSVYLNGDAFDVQALFGLLFVFVGGFVYSYVDLFSQDKEP